MNKRMNEQRRPVIGTNMMPYFALTVIAALFCILSGCSSSPAPAAAATPRPATYTAPVPVQPQQAQPDFIATGPIVVENQIDLEAERDGVVAEILTDTGASVAKGQLLAKLDSRQLTADRDAAAAKARSIEADVKNWEAAEKVARSDFERSDALWNAKVISKELADHARYQHEAVQFEVERERENLKYAQNTAKSLDLELEKANITAPFAGIIARRYIHTGQEVSKNDRLFWISATGPLRLKFTLPEAYVGRVKRGTDLIVSPVGAPAEVHQARVMMVSPLVDPSSDTIDVTAELLGRTTGLRPGMTANIRLHNSQ
ncbi:MAG TPA: efflux RND transporter periplasmic adaptor subunit [Terriglobales bacterium]|nr:efflux RND transporter periplasmic adaptor subunit [Terriglobales bacterium]